MTLRLIVGLCNPGKQYEETRHNAGSWFVEALASRCGAQWRSDTKLFGRTCRIQYRGYDTHLLLPDTFMNLSGKSVAAAAQFYKIPPEQILIAHDELDLSPGTARFKLGGGHGGHNGLRDIIPALGNANGFYRLRVGIGHPGHARAVSNYVLTKPSQDDKIAIDNIIDEALHALDKLLDGDFAKAMTQLHSTAAGKP